LISTYRKGAATGRAFCMIAKVSPAAPDPIMTAKDDPADDRRIQAIAAAQPPFAKLMGVKVIEASRDKVVAEILVREELTNRNGGLHGGAVMGIADNMGGTATFLNMPPGAGTTTIESKTNFFAAVPAGDTIRAECTPLHRGRTTMVWQTRIIQTQLITAPRG
jgi:1,4-dihydroxy-2-naphthoyl-CoA hydrolase